MRFGRALKGYTFKEFSKVLNGLGFFEHHRNSTHAIFTDIEMHYVTVPFTGKEVNHMMSTVTLQRIKNKQLRKLLYIQNKAEV